MTGSWAYGSTGVRDVSRETFRSGAHADIGSRWGPVCVGVGRVWYPGKSTAVSKVNNKQDLKRIRATTLGEAEPGKRSVDAGEKTHFKRWGIGLWCQILQELKTKRPFMILAEAVLLHVV